MIIQNQNIIPNPKDTGLLLIKIQIGFVKEHCNNFHPIICKV